MGIAGIDVLEGGMVWNFRTVSADDAAKSRREFMVLLRSMASAASDFDAAELIFGELVGNVVVHAPGWVTVTLVWKAENPVLIVHDEEKLFSPRFALPDDPLQENGRGLYIVRTLAKSVTIRRVKGDGTKVMATLPVWRDQPSAALG
jgi:anti-sigma regulatory factor (Ser/Thr protein kinase)